MEFWSRELAIEQRTQQLPGVPSPEDLTQASELLNRTNSPNLWDYTHWIDGNISLILSSVLFRTDLNIFRGYSTEEELVAKARQGIPFVLAGLVFQVQPLPNILPVYYYTPKCRTYSTVTLQLYHHLSATRSGLTPTW